MKVLKKVAIVAVVAGGLGGLFIWSVRQSGAEPYAVETPQLARFTLAMGEGDSPSSPMLVLRGPGAMVESLSHQLFKRMMESFSSPGSAQIPLLMKGEYDRALAGRLTPEQILAAARAAGLESGPLRPRCMAYKRVSDPMSTRQAYFVIFDLPAFEQFRNELGRQSGAVGFVPSALRPAMMVAASNSSPESWLPLDADAARDCVAPIGPPPR